MRRGPKPASRHLGCPQQIVDFSGVEMIAMQHQYELFAKMSLTLETSQHLREM